MIASKEIKINRIEMTPRQYGEQYGVGEAAVRSRCEQGLLNAYRTEGGHWKIVVRPQDVVDIKEYEALVSENAQLKAVLKGIRTLASSQEI